MFRITISVKIGNSRWIETKKLYCEETKELTTLVKKHKSKTDRINKNRIRETKFVVEEFLNGEWVQTEQYPIIEDSIALQKNAAEKAEKIQAQIDKWEKIRSDAEGEQSDRKRRNNQEE